MPKHSKKAKPRSASKTNGSAQKEAFQKEKDLYKRGLLIRGEAAKRGKDGKLPPGVTHEIVGDRIVRARFSLL